MAKKKSSLMKLFLIIMVIEIILVVVSGNFSKEFVIYKDGKFVFRNEPAHFDLQEKITEEFQIDEYVKQSSIVHSYDIIEKDKFISILRENNKPIINKFYSTLKNESKETLKSTKVNEIGFNKVIQNLSLIFHNEIIFEESFRKHIELTAEVEYLINQIKSTENNKQVMQSDDERMRLNRILLEASIPSEIMIHQEAKPRVYGNYKMYTFFRNIFGKATAISAFQLIRMLLIVDLFLLALAFLIRRSAFKKPSQPQIMFELIYTMLEDFVRETLGKDRVHFTPYIVTLFIFIWTSNLIGMIPIPGFMEPTRNLNVPLGLGVIAVVVVHFTAIRVKGLWGHLQQYVNPVKNPLFLLDIIGELSKIVSISFRLFGNILGGAIIILVVSSLVKFIIFPVGLNLFFGMFVGTIQAFVFTMLALTYIGVEISE